MHAYQVRFNADFADDVSDAFQWGVDFWGTEAAIEWYCGLEDQIRDRLSAIPKGCAIAPEDDAFSFEVRQLVLGRYRVLFTIDEDVVRVLYLRGPYLSS